MKATIFPVSSPVSEPADLTLKRQTDRTGAGRPLALHCHSSESTHSPLHLSDSPVPFCSLLFSLFMFHHEAYHSPLSLIEECPGEKDILCFIVAPEQGFKGSTFTFGALRGQNSSTVSARIIHLQAVRILTKIQQISDKCRVIVNFFIFSQGVCDCSVMSPHSGFPAHWCLCTPPGLLSP